jgi:hypothetical protein
MTALELLAQAALGTPAKGSFPPTKKFKYLKYFNKQQDALFFQDNMIVNDKKVVLDAEQLHIDEATFQHFRKMLQDDLKMQSLVPENNYTELVRYTNLADCKKDFLAKDRNLLNRVGEGSKKRLADLHKHDRALLQPTQCNTIEDVAKLLDSIYAACDELAVDQPGTAVKYSPQEKAKVKRYFMSFMLTNPSYTKQITFIQLTSNGAIMLWYLKDQIDLRCNVKGDASLTDTFHDMAKKYISGFVVTMLYCFVRGPKTGGDNKRNFRLGKLAPNNPYTIWVVVPLLTFAKKLFGGLFMLELAKNDSPHKFIDRLKGQQKKYGIHSLAALERNIGSQPSWVHGLYLEVHHLATLITTHHKFTVPPKMEEHQMLHFEDDEKEVCEERAKLRPPLIIEVEAGKPYEINALPYDENDDDDDMEDPDG